MWSKLANTGVWGACPLRKCFFDNAKCCKLGHFYNFGQAFGGGHGPPGLPPWSRLWFRSHSRAHYSLSEQISCIFRATKPSGQLRIHLRQAKNCQIWGSLLPRLCMLVMLTAARLKLPYCWRVDIPCFTKWYGRIYLFSGDVFQILGLWLRPKSDGRSSCLSNNSNEQRKNYHINSK